MSQKRVALLTRFIEDEGLRLECFIDRKDGRISARAVGHDGSTRVFSLSNTATQDPRGDLNERARIRRWCVELLQPKPCRKPKPKLPEMKLVAALAPPSIAAPMPEPIPLNAPTMPAAKRPPPKTKRLSMAEQYKLIEWFKTIDTLQYEHMAHLLRGQTPPVSAGPNAMADAMGVLGLKFKKRAASVAPKADVIIAKMDVLANELRRFMASIGYEPSNEFKDIWPS